MTTHLYVQLQQYHESIQYALLRIIRTLWLTRAHTVAGGVSKGRNGRGGRNGYENWLNKVAETAEPIRSAANLRY